MPPFNGRQLQQQFRAFLVFIQLRIMIYLLFLRRPQQPPPPARQRPRRSAADCGCDRNPSREAKRLRDYLKDYFNNEGAVTWQDGRIIMPLQ